jgi:hypothetical protein
MTLQAAASASGAGSQPQSDMCRHALIQQCTCDGTPGALGEGLHPRRLRSFGRRRMSLGRQRGGQTSVIFVAFRAIAAGGL